MQSILWLTGCVKSLLVSLWSESESSSLSYTTLYFLSIWHSILPIPLVNIGVHRREKACPICMRSSTRYPIGYSVFIHQRNLNMCSMISGSLSATHDPVEPSISTNVLKVLLFMTTFRQSVPRSLTPFQGRSFLTWKILFSGTCLISI